MEKGEEIDANDRKLFCVMSGEIEVKFRTKKHTRLIKSGGCLDLIPIFQICPFPILGIRVLEDTDLTVLTLDKYYSIGDSLENRRDQHLKKFL